MLNEVTSLFDYFNKCKQDKHYKRAAIMAYRHNYKTTVSFIKAKAWIDKWIESTVRNEKKGTGFQTTCGSMTDFLNRFIRRINQYANTRKARMVEGGTPTPVAEPPEH